MHGTGTLSKHWDVEQAGYTVHGIGTLSKHWDVEQAGYTVHGTGTLSKQDHLGASVPVGWASNSSS